MKSESSSSSSSSQSSSSSSQNSSGAQKPDQKGTTGQAPSQNGAQKDEKSTTGQAAPSPAQKTRRRTRGRPSRRARTTPSRLRRLRKTSGVRLPASRPPVRAAARRATRAARVRRSPRPRTARTRNAGNKYPAIESPASAGLFSAQPADSFVTSTGARPLKPRAFAAAAREIDDAAAHERPAVVDPHGDAASVALVGHLHIRSEWQRAMRRGETAWVGSAGGGFFAE